MMNVISITDIVVLAIGGVFLLAWLFFYFKGLKNANLFENLDPSDYPMGDTYFVGYAITEMLNLDYATERAQKLRRNLSVLYEPKFADYYIRVVYSMQITMTLTVACFAAPLYFLVNNIIIFIFMLLATAVVYYYYGISMEDRLKARAEEMLSDFSEVVSKLALLVNSGMILSEAWERVAFSGDRNIYQEMRRSVDGMHNGASQQEALFTFGQRCMLPEIKKFSTSLIQGLAQGNSELGNTLTEQSKEVWDLKRHIARRKGEQANSKLLIPMCITFIGILIMIMVPIFANLGT